MTENKRALVKFLYTVNWDEESEVNCFLNFLSLHQYTIKLCMF